MYKILGFIGQWLGLLMSSIGLALMIKCMVDISTIFVTAGALVWGIATKIKYYKGLTKMKKVLNTDIDHNKILDGIIAAPCHGLKLDKERI